MRSAAPRLVLLSFACALGLNAAAQPAATSPSPAPAPRRTPPPRRPEFDPPFDVDAPTPHRISITLDTAPARDFLTLLTGGPEATATLRRLRASRAVNLAVKEEGLAADDFFGRLVASVAGTPDPLLAGFARSSERYRALLDTLAADAPDLAALGARRIASVLPPEPALTEKFVLVPFFSTAGFSEVLSVRDGDTVFLIADVPRILGDPTAPTSSREVMLAMLRASLSRAWKAAFDEHFKKPPIWPDGKTADFDALLALTVEEGPATLFLFPDEFSPIGSLLEEPITRSFARWNRAVEALTDPKKKEADRREVLAESVRGDFWRRHASIVGAEMTDALIRRVGRAGYLRALAAGPRAVGMLYYNEAKSKKLPMLGTAAKKALESPPPPTPTPAGSPTPFPTYLPTATPAS